MGLSPRHRGFYYICSWLFKAASTGAETDAEKMRALFYQMDNPIQADRAMRTAIRYAWDVAKGGIRELFPHSKYPPVPIEFVHAMLWKIEEDEEQRLERERKERR